MEATAKHDFRATQQDELSFTRGATLKVVYYYTLPVNVCFGQLFAKCWMDCEYACYVLATSMSHVSVTVKSTVWKVSTLKCLLCVELDIKLLTDSVYHFCSGDTVQMSLVKCYKIALTVLMEGNLWNHVLNFVLSQECEHDIGEYVNIHVFYFLAVLVYSVYVSQ